jgi:hypothetical protein
MLRTPYNWLEPHSQAFNSYSMLLNAFVVIIVMVIIIVIVIIIGQCFWLALSVKGQQGVDVFLQQLKSQRIRMPIAGSSP